MARDVFGDIFVRYQNTSVPGAKPKHHRAIHGLHGGPMLIEIDMNIFEAFAGYRLRIRDKSLSDVAGAFPDMRVGVDDHPKELRTCDKRRAGVCHSSVRRGWNSPARPSH